MNDTQAPPSFLPLPLSLFVRLSPALSLSPSSEVYGGESLAERKKMGGRERAFRIASRRMQYSCELFESSLKRPRGTFEVDDAIEKVLSEFLSKSGE